MNILLLHIGSWIAPNKGGSIPLGLAYLSSSLKKAGFDPKGLDLAKNTQTAKENYLKAPLKNLDQIKDPLKEDSEQTQLSW